jgi:hypothetical protein
MLTLGLELVSLLRSELCIVPPFGHKVGDEWANDKEMFDVTGFVPISTFLTVS